jgi:hypothetical protein
MYAVKRITYIEWEVGANTGIRSSGKSPHVRSKTLYTPTETFN